MRLSSRASAMVSLRCSLALLICSWMAASIRNLRPDRSGGRGSEYSRGHPLLLLLLLLLLVVEERGEEAAAGGVTLWLAGLTA